MTKASQALTGFATITVLYVAALLWADSHNDVFGTLPRLGSVMPVLVGCSLLSYVVRYARWHWLLVRAGHRVPLARGFVAYLAGFAFTATPGKVGELLRIRYFLPLGVAGPRVFAAFVYERAFDLVAVLALASLAITRLDLFAVGVAFVAVFLTVLVVVAARPGWLSGIAAGLDARGFERLARLATALRDGLALCRVWATPGDAVVCFFLGLLAWTIASGAFVWLLGTLDVAIAPRSAIAIYPLAMLAGAASMVPGGVGSTEVAIVAILHLFAVPVGVATLAAVGIRLASLWFAILCGLLSIAWLEASTRTRARAPATPRSDHDP